MYYVGALRPNGAQVGRFSSWGTVAPKGSRCVHKSFNRIKSNYIAKMLKVRNFEIAINLNIFKVIFTEFKYFTIF